MADSFKFINLPEELLLDIIAYLRVKDATQLSITNKSMKQVVSFQIESMIEKEESERQWRLMKEEYSNSGFRNIESSVDNAAFEKGVKDAYIEHCNASFIDGQWKGYQFAKLVISKLTNQQ